jgi:TPP-dependent 2-oxoacid decarboxylase
VAGTRAPEPQPAAPSTPLTQDLLWHRIGGFLQPGDIISADQGTPFYRLLDTLPAIAGAQVASMRRRRSVLVIGDGAAQLTVYEIGTISREGLDPIIFLVNNDGYTVERAIDGPNAAYNDIARWNWSYIPAAFGAEATVARVRTIGELDTAIARLAENEGQVRVIEAMLGKHDLPQVLSDTARAIAKRNSRSAAPC